MPVAFPSAAAYRNEWQGISGVCVAVAHAASVEDQRMIEQRRPAVRSIGRGVELVQELHELLNVESVDLRIRFHLVWIVAMMRQRVNPSRC